MGGVPILEKRMLRYTWNGSLCNVNVCCSCLRCDSGDRGAEIQVGRTGATDTRSLQDCRADHWLVERPFFPSCCRKCLSRKK